MINFLSITLPTHYYTHIECQHHRKVKLVERCETFAGGNCVCLPVCIKKITAPSLCVSCFREEEADIDATYYAKIESINRTIAEHEAKQAERQIRGRAQGATDMFIAYLEQEIKDVKKERELEIKEFRTQQGVWADG